MRKKPTLELPQYVHRIFNGAGQEYFYFQRGRGSASPGPRVRLPRGPHTPEFWAAYQSYLGNNLPTGTTFDDLINAYKVSPEFLKRAEATRRDYARYLDIISTAWGKPGSELQAKARHSPARQVGEYAGRGEHAFSCAQVADRVGHPARVLGDRPMHSRSKAGDEPQGGESVACLGLQGDRGVREGGYTASRPAGAAYWPKASRRSPHGS